MMGKLPNFCYVKENSFGINDKIKVVLNERDVPCNRSESHESAYMFVTLQH
jgi:hypothetical protein